MNPTKMTFVESVKSKLHRLSHIVLDLIEFCVFHILDAFRPQLRKLFEFMFLMEGMEINGPNSGDVTVFDERLYAKLLSSGKTGLFECYINKWFDTEDIEALIYKIHMNKYFFFCYTYHPYNVCMGLINRVFDVQTVDNSWKDGGEHYDYGIDLYKATTGPELMYSCLRFENDCDLAEAEQNQLKHLAKLLKLEPGMTVLDIGCGFGAVAEYLAENCGVTVTGISPSKDMVKYASERCKGLNVTILLKDYREIDGKFDRVICIEMSEHVGMHKYKAFLKKCHELLKDDGLFLLQVIANNQSYVHEYSGVFEKCLGIRITFPQVKRVINDSFGLFVVEYFENNGYDYGLTWQAWYANFMKNWPSISHLYDERFFRKWSIYLMSGVVAFKSRKKHNDVIIFSKDGFKCEYRVNRE